MGPPWTAAEEDLLFSLIHSSSCGGLCRIAMTWKEIADSMTAEAARRGINIRVYNSSSVAYHYAQMPKEHFEQDVQVAVARMVEADGCDPKSAKAPVPRREGPASRKLPPPQSPPKVIERATQATGPPKDFERCKDQKGRRHEQKKGGLT